MHLQLTEHDLKPIVQAVVAETLASLEARGLRENERLAYTEVEAAGLLGMAKHQLRDCRLRGLITASRPGKSYLYTKEELVRFLERSRS